MTEKQEPKTQDTKREAPGQRLPLGGKPSAYWDGLKAACAGAKPGPEPVKRRLTAEEREAIRTMFDRYAPITDDTAQEVAKVLLPNITRFAFEDAKEILHAFLMRQCDPESALSAFKTLSLFKEEERMELLEMAIFALHSEIYEAAALELAEDMCNKGAINDRILIGIISSQAFNEMSCGRATYQNQVAGIFIGNIARFPFEDVKKILRGFLTQEHSPHAMLGAANVFEDFQGKERVELLAIAALEMPFSPEPELKGVFEQVFESAMLELLGITDESLVSPQLREKLNKRVLELSEADPVNFRFAELLEKLPREMAYAFLVNLVKALQVRGFVYCRNEFMRAVNRFSEDEKAGLLVSMLIAEPRNLRAVMDLFLFPEYSAPQYKQYAFKSRVEAWPAVLRRVEMLAARDDADILKLEQAAEFFPVDYKEILLGHIRRIGQKIQASAGADNVSDKADKTGGSG